MAYINMAVAKGRLVEEAIRLFKRIDIEFPDYDRDGRKLIFENEEKQFRMVLVKAEDVPTYVERGAADIGIVGKDTLLEARANVYETVDLGFGACKFAVAGTSDKVLLKKRLTVATKYPNVAKEYFYRRERTIDVIKLNGSVELAPLIGLADCIVDIVETGKTLRENGLKVLEEIAPISARLIVNKASFKTNFNKMNELITSVQRAVKEVEVS